MLTRLRSCQALNLADRGQYSVSVCGFIVVCVTRVSHDTGHACSVGSVLARLSEGARLVVVMTLAANSGSTCQSTANPSPPLK